MPTTTDFPINWFSRVVTDASGSSPSYQYLLLHADRATVASGTNFVDHSSWNQTLYTKGTGVIQSTVAGYFGGSGLLLTSTTASADNMRLGFSVPTILVTTATDSRPAMQVGQFFYATSLNSAGMTLWEITNSGQTDYGTVYIYQTGTQWRAVCHFFRSAVGLFYSHEYNISLSTGTWNHFALVRVNTQGPGSHRIGLFHNGSHLTPVAGGNPTSGNGDWRDCSFANPQGDIMIWGGNLLSSAGQGFGTFPGYHDEMQLLYDSIENLVYTPAIGTASDFYSFSIPTTPYTPISGSFNITSKSLSLTSDSLVCTTNAGLALGSVTSMWGNVYISSAAHYYVRSTDTYMWSSAAGILTLFAGTQIDLQSNIGVSAKNFIFDTVTGVKFGTTTNVKLAFYGSSPIVKPANTTDIKDALVNLGLLTDGGATPINLDGGSLIATGSNTIGQTFISDSKNIILGTGTGTMIATATNQKLAFWGAAPVVQATAITAAVGTLTFSEPTTPDYAIQNLTQTTPYGFVTADEAQSVLKVIVSIQSRLGEVITALKNAGILP